jgi:plasmid stabilization system protein ParE
MSYRVELSRRAERDVDQILSWIHERSPQGAASWFKCWTKVLSGIEDHPNLALLAPEDEHHDEDIHNRTFKTRSGRKYRVIFVIRDDVVFVTHVRGAGQGMIPPEELNPPLG